MSITQEQYIEHEVQLRVSKEVSDSKFLATNVRLEAFEKRMDEFKQDMKDGFADMKKNMLWFVAICVSGFAIPVVLKILGVF